MAKELDKYKKEFDKIKKDVAVANTEINRNAQSMGQTVQIRDQGCLQLGLEIQRCKDNGMQGKTVYDFDSDKEVKACLASLNQFQKQIEKEIVRITSLHNKTFADIKKRFAKLKVDLKAECDKRDAKKNRKVAAVDSKSLPDLQKLLAEMKKYTDSREFMTVDAFAPETVKEHDSALTKKLNDAVKQTKDVKLNKFQHQMAEQGLNERVMGKNLQQAMKIYKVCIGHCMVAQEAIKTRQNKPLMEHKMLAAKEFKKLKDIVEPYQLAQKDTWLKSKIRGNAKAENGIKAFNKMFDECREELSTVANARLDR